jgi:hypothetical protein
VRELDGAGVLHLPDDPQHDGLRVLAQPCEVADSVLVHPLDLLEPLDGPIAAGGDVVDGLVVAIAQEEQVLRLVPLLDGEVVHPARRPLRTPPADVVSHLAHIQDVAGELVLEQVLVADRAAAAGADPELRALVDRDRSRRNLDRPAAVAVGIRRT